MESDRSNVFSQTPENIVLQCNRSEYSFSGNIVPEYFLSSLKEHRRSSNNFALINLFPADTETSPQQGQGGQS